MTIGTIIYNHIGIQSYRYIYQIIWNKYIPNKYTVFLF